MGVFSNCDHRYVRAAGDGLSVPVIETATAYRSHAGEHLPTFADVLHPTRGWHNLETATNCGKLAATVLRP